MKNTELDFAETNDFQVVEMSQEEMVLTEGGESVAYYVGYAAGATIRAIEAFATSFP